MTKEIEILITLSIIQKNTKFANSYDITKILSIKFDVIDSRHILSHLKSKELIHVYEDNGIERYTLSKKGEELLFNNRSNLLPLAIQSFPLEKDFLIVLLS